MNRRITTIALSLLIAGSIMITGSDTRAEEAEGPAYSDRVDLDDYEPAPRRERTSVSAPLMVSLAYSFIWLLAVAFLFSLWTRGRRLSDELAAANSRLDMLDGRLRELAGDKSERQEDRE